MKLLFDQNISPKIINWLGAAVPNPFYGLGPIFGRTISRGALLRPYPQFGDINMTEPIGYSWFHSLQTQVERRWSRGFTLQMAYTWSKAINLPSGPNCFKISRLCPPPPNVQST